MSKRAMRNRRVQPSRADLRTEISARELEQEDYDTTRPIYRQYPYRDNGRTIWACCESSIGPQCGHVTFPDYSAISPDGYYGFTEPNL